MPRHARNLTNESCKDLINYTESIIRYISRLLGFRIGSFEVGASRVGLLVFKITRVDLFLSFGYVVLFFLGFFFCFVFLFGIFHAFIKIILNAFFTTIE